MTQAPPPPFMGTPPPGVPPTVGDVQHGYQWNGTAWVPLALTGSSGAPMPPARRALWQHWWIWLVALGSFVTVVASVLLILAVLAWVATRPFLQLDDPVPVVTASPLPEATAATTAETVEMGVFETFTQEGNGDDTITLPPGAAYGIVTFTFTGDGFFFLRSVDETGAPSGGLWVASGSGYTGTSVFGLGYSMPPSALAVTATGEWTATVSPVSEAPMLTLPASGHRDAVYRYDGEDQDASVTSMSATGGITVTAYYRGGEEDYLVMEDTDATTDVVLKGPSMIAVTTDGLWTITS